jgi:hypothetical protein
MTLEAIREAHRAKPFVAFVIHLADGRRFKVTHPETLFVPPGEKGRTLVYAERDGNIRLFDLLLVVELEILHSNGRRKAG